MPQLRDKIELSPYIVCFTDLLGQRDTLARLQILPALLDDRALLRQLAANMLARLASFRQLFAFAVDISQNLPPFDAQRLPPSTVEEIRAAVSHPIGCQLLSDSAVLFLPLRFSAPLHDIVRIQKMLMIAALCFARGMSTGLVFRAGMEIGLAAEIFQDDDGLYGPALSDAYLLESTGAEYPRVVVGPILRRCVERIWKRAHDADDTSLITRTAALSKAFIVRDSDGISVLDWAGGRMREFLSSAPEIIQSAADLARREEQRFAESGDETLTKRYGRLVAYIERSGERTP